MQTNGDAENARHELAGHVNAASCCNARKLHEIAPDFHPNQVVADFEEAAAAAIRAVYRNDLTVSACWFHYGQAIMKRLKKIGLTEAYQNEETTQAVFRVCLHYRCCRLPTSTQHSRTSRCWCTTIRRQNTAVATVSSVSGSTSHPLARHECPSAAIPRALIAKFHYTGPTAPSARTLSGRVRSGPSSGI